MARTNCRSLTVTLALLMLAAAAPAQFLPANAHVNLYFPQIVDGGTAAQQWQTAINFTNPNGVAATVVLNLYNDNGGRLNLNFGDGPSDKLSVSIPANGSRIIRTKLASNQIVSGWAFAAANAPVLATLTFTQLVDGVPKLSVSAPPTVPGFNYLYPANYFFSVAVANGLTNTPVSVNLTLMNSSGEVVGQDLLALPPNGHTAFTLWQRFPWLDPSFEGSLRLAPNGPQDFNPFVAWGMGSDSSGVIAGLPDGQFKTPQSQWDEIWRVFRTLMTVAPELIGPAPVNLSISSQPIVNASASNGSNVMVTLGLAELLADSPSELAFAIAHELGHIYQQRNRGRREFRPDSAEADADVWGVQLSMVAGYDPYAVAGTLSKLAMATDGSNLSGQFFEDLTALDAHKSFSTRIDEVFDSLQFFCAAFPETCLLRRILSHPHLPASAPLMEIPPSSDRRR